MVSIPSPPPPRPFHTVCTQSVDQDVSFSYSSNQLIKLFRQVYKELADQDVSYCHRNNIKIKIKILSTHSSNQINQSKCLFLLCKQSANQDFLSENREKQLEISMVTFYRRS